MRSLICRMRLGGVTHATTTAYLRKWIRLLIEEELICDLLTSRPIYPKHSVGACRVSSRHNVNKHNLPFVHPLRCLTQICPIVQSWYFEVKVVADRSYRRLCVCLSALYTVCEHDSVCTCIRVLLCLWEFVRVKYLSCWYTWYLSQYLACFCQCHCGWFILRQHSDSLLVWLIVICLSASVCAASVICPSVCAAESNRTPCFAELVLLVEVKHWLLHTPTLNYSTTTLISFFYGVWCFALMAVSPSVHWMLFCFVVSYQQNKFSKF